MDRAGRPKCTQYDRAASYLGSPDDERRLLKVVWTYRGMVVFNNVIGNRGDSGIVSSENKYEYCALNSPARAFISKCVRVQHVKRNRYVLIVATLHFYVRQNQKPILRLVADLAHYLIRSWSY